MSIYSHNSNSGEIFRCLGVEIQFPYKGYGVQKSMMSHIIRTLTNKQNSLIESPTGTGKTLVLLCSTLAWLKKSRKLDRPHISQKIKDQIHEERIKALENSKCSCGRRANNKDSVVLEDDDLKKLKKSKCTDDENELPVIVVDEKPRVEIIDLTAEKQGDKLDGSAPTVMEEGKLKAPCKACNALAIEREYSKIITEEESFIPNQYRKIPKIYYGTRTHKQVSQVIRELNKSIYNEDLRMCILSSRERTCINDSVRNAQNRDEECRELLKSRNKNNGPSCVYKIDNLNTTFEAINSDFTEKAWDIEDVNRWSKEHGVCPYFGCRSLQDEADITFCPYNYLLDPKIRRSLKINLKNAIIIFDEAHNIEDICRESASFTLTSRHIEDTLQAINIASSNFVQGSAMSDAYQFFRNILYLLKSFLDKFDFGSQADSSRDYIARKVLTQSEMLRCLDQLELDPDSLAKFSKNLSILRDDDASGNSNQDSLDLNELQYIAQLAGTLEFMYSDNSKNLDDYRCVITKSLVVEKGSNSWKKKKDRNEPESIQSNHITQMSLLCMSPSIAFQKIRNEAWSVLVASGTLSPIESIQTELGCEFVAPFQGSHVIPEDRVFATVLSRGPNGHDLNCSFTNSLSLRFQDEVGEIIRDVCLTVPNGVLCFFPSYDRLENLLQRWTQKGFIGEIKRRKQVFQEQKNISAETFETTLTKYNVAAKNKGGLLLAVYRGKVSEGIDFADSAARAVITIGIPYPNVKEITIGLKREYNDLARREKPFILPGGDWYASQAFRALNQAVGRCIRHREDWGSIIMIDSRLRIGSNVDAKISKWLNQLMCINNDYRVIKARLEDFVSARLGEESGGKKKIKLENPVIDLANI